MIAYFDCYSGISGDMCLAALLDAGVPADVLRAALSNLELGGYELTVGKVVKGGLQGTQVCVRVPGEQAHPHRHLADILELIDRSNLEIRIKERSGRIFQQLAKAEAMVHGISPEEVHFHEVGAVDAIIDVVGTAICLDLLGVESVYASSLPLGSGRVKCDHGILPVPSPAVLELVRAAGAPVSPGGAEVEIVTPTGAAILCELATFSQPLMRVEKIGYGFGQKELSWPNALRVWLGEPLADARKQDKIILIEANIDDMSPELLGYTMERLFALGALDVYFTPIQMKKNRPGVKLSVLAAPEMAGELAEKILTETTTLGVRYAEFQRLKAMRWQEKVDTPWGPVGVKVKSWANKISRTPEYEDCRKIALEHGLLLEEVYRIVQERALRSQQDG
ncbi:MAG: nickel pincer cofactor biosynthesis protein LarC [Chloroflexi bacterium]|nr:nickel pincer cofactor biosynthesis protein LarC [Chloroflexota bacterium]